MEKKIKKAWKEFHKFMKCGRINKIWKQTLK